MEITSTILNGAASIIKGWHPVDPEGYSPYEFTSAKQELNAARSTAWIGVYLMISGRIEFKGPDAAELFNRCCVNRDFGKLKVGGSRHALICDDNGYIAASGIVTRLDEETFRTYCLFPVLQSKDLAELNVEALSYDEYFIQIDGPKSLEILEEACQSDLHDLSFGQNKNIRIADSDVYIHRLGMSGALAYEIHGDPEYADAVYTAVCEAGKKYGAVRQGVRTYCLNHTSGGYPNQAIHFAYPEPDGSPMFHMPLSGSAADCAKNYFVTPYDLGWGNLVNFDHEFPGKAALQKLAVESRTVPVTLEWNLDDVMELYKAEFLETAVEADEGILDYDVRLPEWKRLHADYVTVDGKQIGVTSGRVRDYYHKTFISLAFIDKDYAAEGTEVAVMWGKPGKPQTAIRAKVARFPYYQGEYRNETCDVNKLIPKRF